jgi:predicted RecA/RadA family phage recombinase
MLNKISEGRVLTLTPAGDISGGEGCQFGDALFGVAVADVAANAAGAFETEGVFNLAKESTDVFGVGTLAYWKAADSKVTTDAADGDNILVGVAVSAAGNPSSAVNVKIGMAASVTVSGA